MKKITLFIVVLLATTIGYAQQMTYNITFEPGTAGGDAGEWSTFENADGDNAAILVANPNTTGANTSATVLQMDTNISSANGGSSQVYAGLQSQQPGALGSWFLETGNETLTMMVYKEQISETKVSFVNATNGTVFQVSQTNTLTNQWEQLTFDISAGIANAENVNINRLVVFPDWQERSQINTNYIDNIVFSANAIAMATEPSDAPEAPTEAPEDVIALYTEAEGYTLNGNNGFNQFGNATLTVETFADNEVLKYANLDYTGLEFLAENLIDATEMTTFHVDVWSPDTSDFKVKLVDLGADANFGGGDDTEFEINLGPTATGSWIAYDIPLADFTGLSSMAHIGQIILVNDPVGTIFVDNMYFHNTSTTQVNEPTVAAPTPTIAATNVISMFSDAYTNVPVNTWRTDWSSSTLDETFMVEGNAAKKYTNLDFNGIETTGANAIDAAGAGMMYFHMNIWTPNMTTFRIKLVDFGGDGFGGGNDTEFEIAFTDIEIGEWMTLDIPLSDFTGMNQSDISQYIISGLPVGGGTVFVDNVYFSTTNTLSLDQFSSNKLQFYPNPTDATWNIVSKTEITKITLMDLLGKKIMTLHPNSVKVSIDASQLLKGIYVAKIEGISGTETIKLIKK